MNRLLCRLICSAYAIFFSASFPVSAFQESNLTLPECGFTALRNGDIQGAFKPLTLCAEVGYSHAQHQLGLIYLRGEDYSIPRNLPKAFSWINKAYESGYRPATIKLAELYLNGLGVKQNTSEAVRLYTIAGESYRDYESMGILALMYYEGNGVSKDLAKAAKWANLGAESSFTDIHYVLGMLTLKGEEGFNTNPKKAAEFLKFSSMWGHPKAQAALAKLYLDGTGVLQDYVIAHMWSNLASAENVNGALDIRNKAERLLTPELLLIAQSKARECYESNFKNCDK